MSNVQATTAQDRISVDITREQLERWAGRRLSDDEVCRLNDMIPNSSIPEAIGTIVAECLNGDIDPDLTPSDFTRGELVHVAGWGDMTFRVTGHIWREGLVSVEDTDGGDGRFSGHEPPERLKKVTTN